MQWQKGAVVEMAEHRNDDDDDDGLMLLLATRSARMNRFIGC
jgi:hypothetical protein